MDNREFEATKIRIVGAMQSDPIERDRCRACRHPPAAPLDAQRPSFNADMLALSPGAPARPECNAEQGEVCAEEQGNRPSAGQEEGKLQRQQHTRDAAEDTGLLSIIE